MIGKGVFGQHFGGLLDYIANGRRSGLVGYITYEGHRIGGLSYANIAANTPEAAAREMEIVARRSKRVKKPVFQLIISLHPEERDKSVGDLFVAARSVVAKLGLATHQAVYAVHLERSHKHCHIAINRVGPDGKAWDMWHSAMRIRDACREVEHELGFTPHEVFQARADAVRAAEGLHTGTPREWTPRQLRIYERTGVPPRTPRSARTKADRERIASGIRGLVSSAVQESGSWKSAAQRLGVHGMGFLLYENKSRRGLQIVTKEGTAIAASAVDRNYSLSRLEARWGTFNLEPRARKVDVLPAQVAKAHRRLQSRYMEETAPLLSDRARLLNEARQSEAAELESLKEHLCERIRRLEMPSRVEAAMKPHALAQYKAVVRTLRQAYREKRDAVRRACAIPMWVDFVVQQAKALVQDAITILSWLRGHMERRTLSNTLVPGTALRTPPEAFKHEGFTASVKESGVVAYYDRKGDDPAFIDYGTEVGVKTDVNGVPDERHIAGALQHADLKWGASSVSGTEVFELFAIGVASSFPHRNNLIERWSARDQWRLRRTTWNAVDKKNPGAPSWSSEPPTAIVAETPQLKRRNSLENRQTRL